MKLYMFRAVPLPIVRIHCTLGTGICHIGLKTVFEQDQDGMVLLESCLQTCVAYTSGECTVNKLLTMDRGTARNT